MNGGHSTACTLQKRIRTLLNKIEEVVGERESDIRTQTQLYFYINIFVFFSVSFSCFSMVEVMSS